LTGTAPCASGTSGVTSTRATVRRRWHARWNTGTPGFEAFIIANEDTVMSRSSASLAAEVFPRVQVTKELGEHETLLSIDKAKRLLGYAPEHSWRNYHSTRTTPTED
jgi:hypothetical protein